MGQPGTYPNPNSIAPKRSFDTDHPYLAAIALVFVAFVLRLALDPLLSERSPLLLFTASIVVAAGRYGTGPGLLAVVFSLIVGAAAFMTPTFPPELSADDIASLGVFIITSVAMLSFAAHLKISRERERQLQSALEQAKTETAMGTMAATLAHELTQPLAAAANYVSAGKRMASKLNGAGRDTLQSGLDEAEAQIKRAGDIIRYARGLVPDVSADKRDASLRTMIANALKPLQAAGLYEDLDMRLEIARDAERLFVNPIQIEQVLLNLIRNACQATPPGRAPQLVVAASVEDDRTVVEVRDFGSGISEEKMGRLFSAGRDPEGEGLGLGLSISRTIIEAHGGTMWARNNLDSGASFLLSIPREQG